MAKFPTIQDYVQALKLVDMMQAPVTEYNVVVDHTTGATGRIKHHIFYNVKFSEDRSKLHFFGFPISMNEAPGYTLINAEDEFMENREFWCGDIKTIFDDYNVSNDKQKGSLVWAATPYRLNHHKEFYVNLDNPAITLTYPYKLLKDLDIYAKPVSTPQETTTGITTFDTILDKPPAGAVPTGITGIEYDRSYNRYTNPSEDNLSHN